MPWIEAVLRGQKVLARANARGDLAVEGGRVEIRYKPNDGRAYRAAAANLAVEPGARVHPDEACAAAEPVASSRDAGARGKAGEAKAGAAPSRAAADPSAWQAYTDGACSGNPGPAGAGVVVVMPGGKMHEGFEYLGEATNNVAELTAVLRAVEAVPPSARGILVHTDSQYAIGVLQKGWKAKANQELVAKTKSAVVERGAKLHYVKGHAGVPLNERADELAREAIRTRRSQAILIPAAK
jgi:ribonuclease HI